MPIKKFYRSSPLVGIGIKIQNRMKLCFSMGILIYRLSAFQNCFIFFPKSNIKGDTVILRPNLVKIIPGQNTYSKLSIH